MSTAGIANPAEKSHSALCPPITFATLLLMLVVGAAFAGLAYFSVTLARVEGRVAAVWLPNAVLLAFLLRRRMRSDWILLAASFAGNIVANLLAGDAMVQAIGLSLANTIEIAIAWKAFAHFTSGSPDMTDFGHLSRFCAIALVAPMFSAVAATPLLQPADWVAALRLAANWVIVDALSLILLTPTLLILADSWQARHRPSWIEILNWLGVVVVGTAVTLFVLSQNDYPFLFMVVAVMLLYTFRLGATGTAISILKICAIASVATYYGYGPINQAGGGVAQKVVTLQIFLAATFVMGLPVAAMLKKGQRAEIERSAFEARFRQIFDAAPVGIYRTDARGRITEVNPAWRELTYLSAVESEGGRWSFALHPDDHERASRHWWETVVARTDYQDEFRFVSDTGSIRWVGVSAKPEIDETGSVTGHVGMMVDTTGRKLAEMELLEARERAERAVEVKSAFLANMSHEIRTPMNGMLGFAELLLVDDLSASQRRSVEMIAESGRAMMRLLNDILDISKIEAGMMSVASEPLDIRHRLNSVTRLMQPIAVAKGLELSLTVASTVPQYVLGDPLRVRQIMLNLVANAVKFTERGSVAVAVDIGRSDAGDTLEFLVRDTGIGIAPEGLEAVFEKFTQADTTTARTYGGTGLGLAISTNLARLMDGALSAESTFGVGSVFRLSLPLKPVQAAPATKPTDLPEGIVVASNRLRILIAEDHDINQQLIMAMAARVGLDADLAHDGAEAIAMVVAAAAAGRPYGLVLMDMQMPNIDGLEATRRLRQSGYDPQQLPIIALTANAYPEDVATCLEAGMQAHMSKPVRLRQLSNLVAIYAEEVPGCPDEVADLNSDSLAARYQQRKHETFAQVRRFRQKSDLPENELTRLLDQLHKLAGTAGQFAESEIGVAAGELERALRSGGPGRFSTVMACEGDKLLRAA